MKIALVLSTNDSYRAAVLRGRPYRTYAPATLTVLARLVPETLGAKVDCFDLMYETLPADIGSYDLVGISSITCGAPYAYRLADSLRARGITVVMGGAHASAVPGEASLHADAVVVGYAERSWPRLLRDWRNGELKPVYRDKDYPFDENAYGGTPAPRAKTPYLFSSVIEASRGCTRGCSFCVCDSLHEGRFHLKPLAAVEREREALGRRILFLDSNFTLDFESRLPLMRSLQKSGVTWYAAVGFDFACDEEKVALAAACGCRGVLIGFESLDPAALGSSAKSQNHPGEYKRAVARLHKRNVGVLGCFVFGLDGDGVGQFNATVDFVKDAGIDVVRYAIATPLPGTAWHEALSREGRLLTDDWGLYDTEHVVFRPRNMDPQALLRGHKWAYRETYRAGAIFARLKKHFTLLGLAGNLGFRYLGSSFDGYRDRDGNGKGVSP